MTEIETPHKTPQSKRRGWIRRSFKWGLLLFVLALVCHRPLVRFIAIQIAARQHLKLDFHLSGTVLTNLEIKSIHVAPNGSGPTPVEKIDIERLRFDYSIPMLVRFGLGEFLRSYEIHHADLAFVALPSKTPTEKREKASIIQVLRTILAQPAAYADRAEIEDFNIRIHAPTNETIVEGVNILLAPDRAGYLRVRRLAAPGIPVWENLNAETSYTARNLFVKNLTITPDLVLRDVNFDASQRAQHKANMSLRADVFGGELWFSMTGNRLQDKGKNMAHSYDTTTRLSVKNVNARAAAAYFGAKNLPVESVASIETEFTGEPEKPRTWRGKMTAAIERVAAGPLQIERVNLNSTVSDGVAKIALDAELAGNTLTVTSTARVPESVNDFDLTEVEAMLQLDATNLPELGTQLSMKDPMSGTATATARVTLRDRVAAAEMDVNVEKLSAGAVGLENARVKLSASKKFGQTGFAGVSAQVSGDIAGLRFQTFTTDSATLRAAMNERAVTVSTLEIHRGENNVSAHGTYEIPVDLKAAAKAPVDAQFAIHAPQIADFGIVLNGEPLEGRITGKGDVKLVDGAPVGDVELDGGGFKLGGFAAESLVARVKLVDRAAHIDELALKLNGQDQISATGTFGFDEPNSYDGKVLVGIESLAVLGPLLEVFGKKESLAGSLHLDWTGKGDLKPATFAGDVKLAVAKAHYGKIDLSEVALTAVYGPEYAKTTELRIVSGPTKLEATLDLAERKLRLQDINLQQGGQPALTGYLFLPIDLASQTEKIPLEERLATNLTVNSLDLDKLFASFGKTSPVSGNISATLISGGTVLNPAGQLQLKARAIKAGAAPQFDQAELDLTLNYSDKLLTLDATARQREIQPLVIKGRLPLDIEKAVKDKAYDPALPIDFTAKITPSSLANVSKFVPAVRRLDGTLALDLRVAGTFGKPEVTMALDVDLKGARMTAENVPAIGAFRAKIGYANEVLTFNNFKGELGGGTFKLSGTVQAPELAQLSFVPVMVFPKAIMPVFDLRFESDEVLVLRNDSITVRADSDVKLAGPLNAAAATGTIYVTHSRFFKEIDILPIGLPGRPKPAPKSAPSQANISFPNAPLRDWKFDIAIKTRDDDPFLVRGNLANGAAALSLRLAGTGLKPWLDGNIRIDSFNANLPFSRLSITRGFIYFGEDAPFQPSLDLQAESRAGNYLIGAYIYGTASNPQIALSSEPPLPHADIVSLLATGTTTAELGANAEALASRAAILAVKQLYQKVFKRSTPPPPTKAKTEDGNLLDRFQMELGSTDNRSGRQQVITRIKINDQLYLIGDAGVDGQFTGRLKYLIRFR